MGDRFHEYWRCEKCNIEKTKISYLYGGWEYFNPTIPFGSERTMLNRPECETNK